MNGRKAKRLRRSAEKLSKGLPMKRYGRDPVSLSVRLFNCTRDVCLRLKAQARAGTR